MTGKRMNKTFAGLIVAIIAIYPTCLLADPDLTPPPGGYKDFPPPQTPLTPIGATTTTTTTTEKVTSPSDPKEVTERTIYRTTAVLREPTTGLSVGIFGGGIAFQNGTMNITSPSLPGTQINANTQSSAGGVAGIRFEYTWGRFMSDPNSSGLNFLMPSLEEDLFWTGYTYNATTAYGGFPASLSSNLNTLNFMVDPKLNFNFGVFRPYIGFGIGVTYITLNSTKINAGGATVPLNGSPDDVDFSMAGLVGVDVFVARNWALSFDYRYQYILNPTFNGTTPGGADIKYHLNGLGGNLFTAGINYYF